MIRTILLADEASSARAWLLAHGIEDLVVPQRSEIALLGTGRAVAGLVPADIQASFLVLRAVPPEAYDLSSLLRQHAITEAAVTVALFRREKAGLLGWPGAAAEMDRSGRILRWSPKGDFDRDLDWIDAGAFVITPATLKRAPTTAPFDLVRQLVPLCLRSHLVVRGWQTGNQALPASAREQSVIKP